MARDPLALSARLAAALRFISRLPVPVLPGEGDPHAAPDLRRIAPALPAAGAVIGAIGAIVLALALALRLPAFVAAALAVGALVLVTGALHEDGLADSADGLFGGATPERRLAIMRDSRIGTYGVAALLVILLLRVGAVAALSERLPLGGALLALVAAGAVSRAAMLLPLQALPPARSDGLARAAGAPGAPGVAAAALLACGIALLAGFGAPLPGVLLGLLLALTAARIMIGLARHRLGGHSGDIAGAAQQLAETGFLLGLLTAA